MTDTIHRDVTTLQGVHAPYADQYANAAARNSATGFPGPGGSSATFIAADIGKVVLQLDTFLVYMLTATTPTWTLVSGSSFVNNRTNGSNVTIPAYQCLYVTDYLEITLGDTVEIALEGTLEIG